MCIWYRDITSYSLLQGKFRFKIPRRLGHFLGDYDHTNPTHTVTIELVTSSSVNDIRGVVLPLLQLSTASGGS